MLKDGAVPRATDDPPQGLDRYRDLLVVVLTLTTGALDAVSYLRLGKVFSSVITGNLALLGVAARQRDAVLMLNGGLALAGYVCGVLAGEHRGAAPGADIHHVPDQHPDRHSHRFGDPPVAARLAAKHRNPHRRGDRRNARRCCRQLLPALGPDRRPHPYRYRPGRFPHSGQAQRPGGSAESTPTAERVADCVLTFCDRLLAQEIALSQVVSYYD